MKEKLEQQLQDHAAERLARAASESLQRGVQRLTESDAERAERQAREEEAASSRKTKTILGVVGLGVAGLFVLGLMAKLWALFVSTIVVVGIGAGVYFVAKPKLAKAKERLAARAVEKDKERVAQARERSLEDELARLKREAGGGS